MALTRLFVHGELRPGLSLQLDPEQARYLGRVLRLRPGESLLVFNGECGEFAAVIDSLGKSTATVTIGAAQGSRTESPLRVHLVQGVSRGERMDIVVQKATELGVKRITPVLTEFGVVKLAGERADQRRDHWQKIANSAAEQCGRIRPPLIDVAVPLKSWFGNKTKDADVDLILQPGAPTAMTALAAPRTKVCLLIGPEGGFSAVEYDDAALSGFTAVSLGPRVLRTETAALTAIAIAEALWGDLGPN
ncbi:MAG: 16S rRNA (uracil(1498)-N(3))-methyltransferase [Proteobacteria bacterium]|nr:16S rRNA (uracil(1498)-N(3))-methyltransferase [Pseudomonadota bacterium]MDA1064333.1 16S rRNA (uracil(1498)-N(3))-methyltransferase [Pseudomonadota bacterium]